MLSGVMRWIRWLPVALGLWFSGCVYFNLMYNAKRYFRMGETEYRKSHQLTAQARQYYQRAVEKAAKVVKYHPRSKYVPEALYIMAVSFSRMDERGKARRKFEELALYYPEAAKRFKIDLELGRLALEDGDYSLAREHLSRALRSGGEQAEEAAVLLAESYAREGDFTEALKQYQEFLNQHPESPWRKQALYEAAEAAFKAGHYREASEYLTEYLSLYLTSEEEKQAKLLLAEVYLEQGRLAEAEQILNSLDLPPADQAVQQREVLRARVLLAQGDTAEAVRTLRNVTQRTRRQEADVEARYRLGLVLEAQDSLEQAYDLYKEASRMSVTTPYRDLARRRMLALSELRSIDSTRTALDLYRIAELYLFELQREPEAVDILKQLLREYPTSEYAPKALYTLVYLYSQVLPEEDSARKYYARLQRDFAGTLYAQEARQRFAFLETPKEEP